MEYDRIFQELVVSYIDSNDEDNDILDEIISYQCDIKSLVHLLSNISCYHPQYNQPDRFAKRICNIIDTYGNELRKQLDIEREYIVDTIKNSRTDIAKLITRISEMLYVYSYETRGFSENDGEDLYIVVDVINYYTQYIKSNIHPNSTHGYDKLLDYINEDMKLLIKENRMNHKHEIHLCNHIQEDLIMSYINEHSKYIPSTNGRRKSVLFDYFHIIMNVYKDYLEELYKNFDFMMQQCILKTDVNIVMMYKTFENNKRVLLHLHSNYLLPDYNIVDECLYYRDIIEIIDYDDVERFVSYITVTKYNLNTCVDIQYRNRHMLVNILEYSMFKGSFNIFKYIVDVVKFFTFTSIYPFELVLYGGNPEMIHYVEDNERFNKRIDNIINIVICTYNFDLLRYFNNMYTEKIFEVAIKESNTVKKHIYDNYFKDIIEWCQTNKQNRYYSVFDGNDINDLDDTLKGKISELLATKYNDDVIKIFPDTNIESIKRIINVKNDDKDVFKYRDNSFKEKYHSFTPLQRVFIDYKREIFDYIVINHLEFIIDVIKREFDYEILKSFLEYAGEEIVITYLTKTFMKECEKVVGGNLGENVYDEIMKRQK